MGARGQAVTCKDFKDDDARISPVPYPQEHGNMHFEIKNGEQKCERGAIAVQIPSRQRRLAAWTDDLACFAFGLAHCVTVMYYSVDRTTKQALQSSRSTAPLARPHGVSLPFEHPTDAEYQ